MLPKDQYDFKHVWAGRYQSPAEHSALEGHYVQAQRQGLLVWLQGWIDALVKPQTRPALCPTSTEFVERCLGRFAHVYEGRSKDLQLICLFSMWNCKVCII